MSLNGHALRPTWRRNNFSKAQGQRFESGLSAAYIDNVIIYSSTLEQHLQHLSDVFQRIQQAGLVLVRSEVKYLSSVEEKSQIDNSEAVQSCPPPTTKRQVRSFLGLEGWYRRFIPNFANRAEPLTAMTRKSCPVKVKWTAYDAAFQPHPHRSSSLLHREQ